MNRTRLVAGAAVAVLVAVGCSGNEPGQQVSSNGAMDAGSDAAGTGEPTPEIGIDTCDFGVVDAVVADFVEDRSLNGAGLAVVDAEGVVHEECWGEPLYEPYLCQFLDGDLQECGRIIATTPDDDADVIAPDTEYW